MKMKHKIYPVLLLSLFCFSLKAQDTMYIHTTNSEILRIAIDDIDSIIFYPEAQIPSNKVTDVDGNQYNTISIGTQVWMAENLKVTHAPDGLEITSYAYNNNDSYAETYGRLYTWSVAMNGETQEKAQGICPCGWHIPSDKEFKVLEKYYGMTDNEANMINTWRGSGIGTKFKSDDEDGYRAKLSGRRTSSGQYSLLNVFEYMWTSSEYGDNAWRRCLDLNSEEIGRWNTFPKTYGFSVRCIKDNE
ncbi:MAG: hypothetical protein GVY19_11540 [Bacteroidetes bacterium]|nr:hypothetical protein [Bacteroidota bacterium]